MNEASVVDAFNVWTLGRGGSGAIYQTEEAKLDVKADAASTQMVFKAYQRRSVNNGGLLTKQLICFWQSADASKAQICCVRKTSRAWRCAMDRPRAQDVVGVIICVMKIEGGLSRCRIVGCNSTESCKAACLPYMPYLVHGHGIVKHAYVQIRRQLGSLVPVGIAPWL